MHPVDPSIRSSSVRRPLIFLFGGLLVAALACNLVGDQESPDSDRVATAVQETLVVQQAQTAAAGPPTEVQISPTSTPEAVESPTATLTATPALTATPSVPIVSVSVDTNCRVGPGIIYDYRGALLVGETAEVVARSTVGNYWYIVNPDNPADYCYLWGEYATVAGNTNVLPAFTPPPSPTPTHTPTPTLTPIPT